MAIGIYKIENLINGKVYIGQSVHIEKRWTEHCRPSTDSLIGRAIKKYGKENFSFQILQEVSEETELNQLESFYIKKFNSLTPNGYNIVFQDSQEHHNFSKYSLEKLLAIVDDIKNTKLSFKEIAKKHDLDLSMIYYLNRGDFHKLSFETYPLRSVQDMTKKQHFCVDCGIEISKGAVRCVKCDHLKQRKVDRLSREQLKNLIRTQPFTTIAAKFGVTDKAIRKWCKAENLPSKVSEIKQYSDLEWEKI